MNRRLFVSYDIHVIIEVQTLLRNPRGLNYYFSKAGICTRMILLWAVIYHGVMLRQYVHRLGKTLGGSTSSNKLNTFFSFVIVIGIGADINCGSSIISNF